MSVDCFLYIVFSFSNYQSSGATALVATSIGARKSNRKQREKTLVRVTTRTFDSPSESGPTAARHRSRRSAARAAAQ
jgi:hypothetical protein